jgi:hypothetical protein
LYAAVGWGASLGALYLKKLGRNIVFSSPLAWSNESCIFAELVDGSCLSTLFKKNKYETLMTDSQYHCKGLLLPFSVNDVARWGIRKDFKLKSRIFTILKSVPYALQFGRRFWFAIVKPVKDFIVNALKDKYTAERGLTLKDGDELRFTNSLKADRNKVKQVYVQEMLYHMDSSKEYTYEGGQHQVSAGGALSFISDTLIVKDKLTGVKIAGFSFDSPINIIVNTLSKQESEVLLQHAVGYLTKIRFQASYAECENKYYLDYTLKVFA